MTAGLGRSAYNDLCAVPATAAGTATGSGPGASPAQVADHRPLLEAAGFVVEAYEEPPDWERGQRAVYAGILEAQSLLVEEMGEPAARRWIEQAQQRPDELPHARSILVVAHRT